MEKKRIRHLPLFLCLFLVTSPVFAICDRHVQVDPPQMEWFLDECGHWHQGYPDDQDYGTAYSVKEYNAMYP